MSEAVESTPNESKSVGEMMKRVLSRLILKQVSDPKRLLSFDIFSSPSRIDLINHEGVRIAAIDCSLFDAIVREEVMRARAAITPAR